ncbi:MAG: hypothetical protein KatS3mg055_2791 [Chloroflexus sp.]|nr:MAG: hypothetical protein KatS3mg055_2791 [Chloroflexus sp.]
MPLSRQRLVEQVIEHLRQQLKTQTYPVGSRLASLAPRAADALVRPLCDSVHRLHNHYGTESLEMVIGR